MSSNQQARATRKRRRLARTALAGYAVGPSAPAQATTRALAKTAEARSIILVEGISDQIAVETLAVRRGRDLNAERVVVLPMGGAHTITRYLLQFGPHGSGQTLAGLCDEGEEEIFRRGLTRAGLGEPATRAQMGRLGFFVCVADLEDELIRAAGRERIEALQVTQGDLGAFRRLQRQPAWRGRPFEAQMRRWVGAGASRKLRYARLLVETLSLDRVPDPLDAVLAGT